MSRDFPEFKTNSFCSDAYFRPDTNTIYLGYRSNGHDEELIEAMVNHEIMHWVLKNLVSKRACRTLDRLLYGLHPDEIGFVALY